MLDLIIIGAGVVGLGTAMYAGRLDLDTLVLGEASGTENAIGGTITLTEIVENYPGFKKLTGSELAKKIEEHAKDYDCVEIKNEKAIKVMKGEDKNCFKVKTKNNEYRTLAIVFATGTKWRKLPIKGAKEFEGKGVHYCALCDGPLMREKTVAVIGGSDTASKEALLLAEYADRVYIIYRGDEIHPEPVNAKRVEKNKKIKIINDTNVKEIKGNKHVEKVLLDKEFDGSKELELDAVFGAIGNEPNSGLARDLVELNEKGEIKIDRESNTGVPGVFAAGDVTDTAFKQAVTGVSEGVHAAHSAYQYITDGGFVCPFYDEKYPGGE